jgi:S1-C subfamily serine protease
LPDRLCWPLLALSCSSSRKTATGGNLASGASESLSVADTTTSTSTTVAPLPTTAVAPPKTTTTRPPVRVVPRTVPVSRAPKVTVSPLTVAPVTVHPVTAQPLERTPAAIAADVLPGVVDVDAILGEQQEEALGTGMVLTSSGVILTNNHVIDGATSITVTEVSTGQTFTASVIGDDPSADVAALQLQGASGLPTIPSGDSATVTPGQAVVGIGNAEGAGGEPTIISGTVEATDQSILASDSGTGTSEELSGLIETDTDSVPGDSGGPLVDESGLVVGMTTAGAVANGPSSTEAVSFAIPIDEASDVVQQIVSGQASSTVFLGLPGFLGVELTPGGSSGAQVSGVEVGSPAAQAGLLAGSRIVAVNGVGVGSASALAKALQPYRAGAVVTVTWFGPAGVQHGAVVTLSGGPAD